MAQPVQQLEADDERLVQQASMTMQAMLASKENSESLVKMAASGPDGIAKVVLMGVAMMEQRGKLDAENAAVAAVAMLTVLLDFLVKVQAVRPDQQNSRAVMAAVMDAVAQRYGASDEDIAELDQMMPGLAQEIMARRGSAQPGQLQAQPGQQLPAEQGMLGNALQSMQG